MATIINKILKNDYIFSIFTKIITICIAFFHSIVLARYLGADLKGIHAIIFSIVSLGAILVNMSAQQAYPFFRKKYGKDNYYNKFMSLMILHHLLFMLIASGIILFFPNLSTALKMSIILIPIDGFAILIGYICLVEHPRKRNFALLCIDIIDTLVIIIMMIFSKAKLEYIFIIFFIPYIIKIIYFTFINKFKFDKNCFKKEFIMELVKYSFFPMIAMLLVTLNYKVDILMLQASDVITMSQIGVYSIGISLADKVMYLPDAIKEILLSKLAKGKGQDEVAMTMRICFPLSLLITLVLVIIGEPFIEYMYGSEYAGAYLVTLICVLGTSMMVFFKMISQYNNVNGHQQINVVLLLIIVIVNVLLNLLFIPIFEIVGAALATLISYTICAILFLFYFKKKTGLKIREMTFPIKSDIEKLKNILKGVKKTNS